MANNLDIDKNILKIYFTETEYMCRLFAKKFNIDTDTVLKEGLKKIYNEYPDIINNTILDKPSIEKLNINQLREELKARELVLTGNKKTLQTRLLNEMIRLKMLITT